MAASFVRAGTCCRLFLSLKDSLYVSAPQTCRDSLKDLDVTERLTSRKLELVQELVDRTDEALQGHREGLQALRAALDSGCVDLRDMGSDGEDEQANAADVSDAA